MVEEIRKVLPSESLIYIADTHNFPYGDKSPKEIRRIAYDNVLWLLSKKTKIIVVACNTATIHSISLLRKAFSNIQFIGMEPGVKPAGITSKKGIAILSSPKSTKSERLQDLISLHVNGKAVFNIGSLDLVKAVEGNWPEEKINRTLTGIFTENTISSIDTVVLGCTHFPLIKHIIQKHVGPNIKVLDSSRPVAERVRFVLNEHELLASNNPSKVIFFTSGLKPLKFRQYKFKPVKFYYVYLLECRDGTIYCGYTTDLLKRVKKHNTSETGAKYTKNRRPVILKYYEIFHNLSPALKREHQLKKFTRDQKKVLIGSFSFNFNKTLS